MSVHSLCHCLHIKLSAVSVQSTYRFSARIVRYRKFVDPGFESEVQYIIIIVVVIVVAVEERFFFSSQLVLFINVLAALIKIINPGLGIESIVSLQLTGGKGLTGAFT
jgi:hypothetical protein